MSIISPKQIQTDRLEVTPDVAMPNNLEKLKRMISDANDVSSERVLLKEYDKLTSSSKLTTAQKKRKKELDTELSMLYGFENGTWVSNLDDSQYQLGLLEMRRGIVEDTECRNTLELMLADRIVASYWRAMRCDTLFNMMIYKDGNFAFNQLILNAMKEILKGSELANRQLHANIILLKELKQPKLDVKVRADNAYFAQNQQVINTEENPARDANPEIIKSK